jgi:hypothetical protein
MNFVVLLISMLFCHILADFNMQGMLKYFKQESYWKKLFINKRYPNLDKENDYVVALLIHSIMWTFMMNLPIILMYYAGKLEINTVFFVFELIVNFIIHTIVNDKKANNFELTFTEDQTIHFLQIFITWVIIILYNTIKG